MANYKLVVDKGPGQGKSYPLASRVVTVGRDPMVDIVIADPEISRQHARFTRGETGYTVQDLGSTNGTFVEGERLRGEEVVLSPGQVISMGSNVTLIYEEDSEPVATVVSPEAEIELPRREKPASERRVSVYDSEAPAESGFDEADDDATAVEFPLADDPEELPSFDEEEEEPRLRETYQAEDDDDVLPSFDEPTPVYAPEPAGVGPPPPPPGTPPPPRDNRNRNIIIAAVAVLLLLCCCCLLLWALWTYGDALLNELQQLERFSQFVGTVPLGR